MARPQHLPDFTDPPLDEVVLGIQFEPVPNYSIVNSWKVWELFKKEFPKVQELPILPPQFETFGGKSTQPSLQFHLGSPPIGSRLWFISADESHLLQFQADRFITNWRKRPNPLPYPRFEGIAEAFESNLKVLSDHFASEFTYQIDVNQAEVAYINLVPIDDFADAGEWFKIWNSGHLNPETLNTSFSEVIIDEVGKPYARLNHEIQTIFLGENMRRAFRFSLTYKGKPPDDHIDSAMKFLRSGRESIVTRFEEMTTAKAHRIWGKIC